MKHADVGIIGGTGLGDILAKEGGEEVAVETPFGAPSGKVMLAEWGGVRVAFLSRHGPGHCFNPSKVPYRANIWAMKKLGVKTIIASGAVGSLSTGIEPGHLVVCDQVIDKTYRREGTFFDEAGVVAHVEMADPFCPRLREVLGRASGDVDTLVHIGGTYVCMEGPQFSTRAESNMHRMWGGEVVGMTAMPEAKLAREAEICYALVALSTDYDCWRETEGGHTRDSVLEDVLANLKRATSNAVSLVKASLPMLGDATGSCKCGSTLKLALWSDLKNLDPALRDKLDLLIGRHLEDKLSG